MLESLAILLFIGLVAGKFISLLRLPDLLGMLLAGIVIGPYVFDILSLELLTSSQQLRSFALIIILLRAGLGLRREQLRKVGAAAIKLSILPCIFEGTTIMLVSKWLLGFNLVQGGLLGFILAAVSPAVVVPSMLNLKAEGYGENKEISTLILAGASMDDVFAITIFTSFLTLAGKAQTSPLITIDKIPLSIFGGILGGMIIAFLLLKIYSSNFFQTRNTEKLLLLIASSIIFYEVGEKLGIASLLGVMVIGLILLEKRQNSANRFAEKLAKIWVFAQVILFALLGAEVNIPVAFQAGYTGLVIIGIGLLGRSVGVLVATLHTNLNMKERLFCVIAYIPKATVQAAIGSLPLALGIEGGSLILAIAVLSILVTAPLGAIGIQVLAPWLLQKSPPEEGA